MDNGKKFRDRFARLYAPIQERSSRVLYDRLAAPCITDRDRVPELACGTGQLTFPLCRRAACWEAIDFSDGMLRELARLSPAALTYEDSSFHVVLIANVLHAVPEPVPGDPLPNGFLALQKL